MTHNNQPESNQLITINIKTDARVVLFQAISKNTSSLQTSQKQKQDFKTSYDLYAEIQLASKNPKSSVVEFIFEANGFSLEANVYQNANTENITIYSHQKEEKGQKVKQNENKSYKSAIQQSCQSFVEKQPPQVQNYSDSLLVDFDPQSAESKQISLQIVQNDNQQSFENNNLKVFLRGPRSDDPSVIMESMSSASSELMSWSVENVDQGQITLCNLMDEGSSHDSQEMELVFLLMSLLQVGDLESVGDIHGFPDDSQIH